MKKIALSLALLMAGISYASAQAIGTDNASPDATPHRGAGVGGVGADAAGPASNQPAGALQPNAAATPGLGTQGSPGNIPAGGAR